MANDAPTDEQRLYKAFQQVINILLPLESDLRERTYATVGTFFRYAVPQVGLASANPGNPAGERNPPDIRIAPREPPSPKDFLLQKEPITNVERVACLAYYLAHYRDAQHFKTKDISRLNIEAAQKAFVNTSDAIKKATQAGFLAPVSASMKQLSALGEQYVDELPDHAAAKVVMQTRKPRRVRRQTAAKRTSNRQEQVG